MSSEPGDRLDSWKEIAAYARRGVRTVRRWEREEGLPVHRHLHRKLSSVYAFRSEIDAWRESEARTARRPAPATSAAATDRSPCVAVLPFANLSADPENEYFAAGLTDEVTADLSKVRALRVISRTSSMTFRDTTRNVREIAGELGARYVLEGSVRRAGSRLRVTSRLIDATSDVHLWADTYDGTTEDVFAIQERLARLIVEALELRLSAEEDRRLAERPIADLRAYECYLRARHEGLRWQREAIDHAIQLLRNGLAIIGDNPLLESALGLAYLQYREAGIDFGETPLREAETCARKVLALQPGSGAGLKLQGWIHYARGRPREAVRDLTAAHEVDPNDADTLLLLANCLLISGKVASARPWIARLLAIDPLTPVNRCMPGYADVLDGKAAAAVGPYREMFEMDPANPMARLFYVWVLIASGRDDEAAAVAASFPAEARDTVPALVAGFLVAAVAGRTEDLAAALTPEVEAIARETDVFGRFLAQGFALAGDVERALDWLEVAVERGFGNHDFLARHDPCLASVRGEPRFARLLEVVRRRSAAIEA